MLPKIEFHVGQFITKFEATLSSGSAQNHCNLQFANEVQLISNAQLEVTDHLWPQYGPRTLIKAKHIKNTDCLYIKMITVPIYFYQTNGKKIKFKEQFLVHETDEKTTNVVLGANFLFRKEIKYLCFLKNEIILKNGCSISFLKTE